ncbi:hypothetical protein L7F22_031205 [Adiantum nelumboides]|nr:hypothetical protein [Adiantum nelumboides]
MLASTTLIIKNLEVNVSNITLKCFESTIVPTFPPTHILNVTLQIQVSFKNPNRVSLKYMNSTIHMFYKDEEVGEVLLPPGEVAAYNSEHVVSTLDIVVMERSITPMSHISMDMAGGFLPLSTTASVLGTVDILHTFQHHLHSSSNCDVTLSTSQMSITYMLCT